MNRRLLQCATLMLGLSGAVGLQAQPSSTQTRIGVIGGLNLATFGGENSADDLGNRMGLLGGVSLVKARSGALGFELDALYAMKGAKSTGTASEATFTVDYIEVPLLLRFDFPTAGVVRPHFVAGPSVALRVGCGAEGKSAGVTVSRDCDEADDIFGNDLQAFDAGLVAGGGVDFLAGRTTVTLGARYSYGLLSIVEEFSTKNRAISVFAGLSIPFSR